MNQNQLIFSQKREEFRTNIRNRRNEQEFQLKRVSFRNSQNNSLTHILEGLNLDNNDALNQAIIHQIPQHIIETLFRSEVTSDYILDLLKNNKPFLNESLYFYNQFSAKASNFQLQEHFSQSVISFFIQLYCQFQQFLNGYPYLISLIDYLDCVFLNLLSSKLIFLETDKKLLMKSIQFILNLDEFQKFEYQIQEAMLLLYYTLQNETQFQKISIQLYTQLVLNFQTQKLLQLGLKIISKTLNSLKNNSPIFLNIINYLNQIQFSSSLIEQIKLYPDITIEYFKHISNYKNIITSKLLEYSQAHKIFDNYKLFDKSKDKLYFFLSCSIQTFPKLLIDIKQNKQFIDELLQEIYLKQCYSSTEAFYLLCAILKLDDQLLNYPELILVLNKFFLESNEINDQKIFLELIIQNPLFLSNCVQHQVMAKIESLIIKPQLETYVRRIID